MESRDPDRQAFVRERVDDVEHPDLASIMRARFVRTTTRSESRGTVSEQTRSFIASARLSPAEAARAVRSHWGIESLHWVLDVVFKEDLARLRRGHAFTSVLQEAGIATSMDGRGAWRDNVFVERLWRSIKDEEISLHAYDTLGTARAAIGRYLAFYNGRRPHTSLDRRTPDQAYFDRLPQPAAA